MVSLARSDVRSVRRLFETLEDYARNLNEAHFPDWKRFNQAVGSDGSVGIWHETFLVESKRYARLYSNILRLGLAQAANLVDVIGKRKIARLRLDGKI